MSSFLQRAGGSTRGALHRLSPRRRPRNSSGGGARAFGEPASAQELVDLTRRYDELGARVAELQWDLGGLVYEMAIRDSIRVDVIVRRAAELQTVDAELSEVERILRLEQTGTAGECLSCGAPHSTGATYCWQCGQPLVQQIAADAVGAPHAR
jgi:hypothetical protein